MINFSTYKAPIKSSNTVPNSSITLFDAYRELLSNKHEYVTSKLRGLKSKAEKTMCKELEFDYITVSGLFAKRAAKAIIQHSNYICIDCDHVGNKEAINDLKEQIKSIFEPALMFTSPSGDGLKIVFQIDISQFTHVQYFKAFQIFFKTELNVVIDEKCSDVSRATFLCYDPECFYAENPTLLGKGFINKYAVIIPDSIKIEQPETNETITDAAVIIERLKVWLNKKQLFVEGNRNGYISELCGAFNRYGISESLALETLLKYSETGFPETGIRGTVKSIYSETSLHNISHFEISKEREPETKQQTPSMPIDGFPIKIQQLIKECSKIYGTNQDLWAAGILAATASAIGQSVILKTKYENPPLLWIAVVGSSGVGKSEPISFAFNPMHEVDLITFKAHQKEIQQYNEACQQPKKKGEKNPAQPSPCIQNVVIDVTPEALAQAMGVQPRGITLIRDELMGMIADFGRYGKSAEEQNMLSTWSQSTYKVNRKNGNNEYIEKPYLNIIGGIQPGLLSDLAKDNRAVNGFLPRFCFVFPDTIKTPTYNSNELKDQSKTLYRDFINTLMLIPGLRNETRLSAEAEQLYAEFINKNAALNDSGSQPDYLNEVNAKLNVIALRLAILFHYSRQVFSGDESMYINGPVMDAAIELTKYFRITARKVFDCVNQNGSNKIDIAKYLQALGNSQSEIANVLKVSQQYVSKLIK